MTPSDLWSYNFSATSSLCSLARFQRTILATLSRRCLYSICASLLHLQPRRCVVPSLAPHILQSGDRSFFSIHALIAFALNPRSLLEKIVTRSLVGGGGRVNRTPSLSTFDTIHPIDLKFDTYNKLHLYFQLSETMWRLIDFHGNNSQINDVTGSHHLGFSNFQILFKFSLLYLRLTGKQHLAVEIHEIGRIHCEVLSI